MSHVPALSRELWAQSVSEIGHANQAFLLVHLPAYRFRDEAIRNSDTYRVITEPSDQRREILRAERKWKGKKLSFHETNPETYDRYAARYLSLGETSSILITSIQR